MTTSFLYPDISISIDIPFQTKSEINAVMKALIPDNINFPKGLSIKMYPKGKILSIKFSCKGIQTTTILNTVDEMLEHISLAKKVIG